MVQITPEEVMAQRKKAQQAGADEMPTWRRQLIGNSFRLDIPLNNPYLLRKVAPILAGLAAHMEFTSHRTDLSEYDILMSIKNEGFAVTLRIRELHGGANKNGTYPKRDRSD